MIIYFIHNQTPEVLEPFFTVSEAWKHLTSGQIKLYQLPAEVYEIIRNIYLSGSSQISGQAPTNGEMQSLLADMELPLYYQKGEEVEG